MDLKKHRMNLLEKIHPLDEQAVSIIELVQERLPETYSILYDSVKMYDHINEVHPIDRLTEYRILSGKMAIAIQNAENLLSSIKRCADTLSRDSRDLLIYHLWKEKDSGGL